MGIVATASVRPLLVAMFFGALLSLATGCMTSGEVLNHVDWPVLRLIACSGGPGTATEITGTAGFLAQWIARIVGGANPVYLLSASFTSAALLTQAIRSHTCAALVPPVALRASRQQHLNRPSFAMMIALAATRSSPPATTLLATTRPWHLPCP